MLVSQLAGLFNIFIGLMLVASLLLFFGGLIGWAAHLGFSRGYRDDMIRIMTWGVAVLFTLLLILALVHLIQAYPDLTSFALGVALFLGLAWLVLKVASAPQGDEDER